MEIEYSKHLEATKETLSSLHKQVETSVSELVGSYIGSVGSVGGSAGSTGSAGF